MTAARWLMDRFGVRSPVIGDLEEEVGCGRSRAWLWRQVSGAVTAAVLEDARLQPWCVAGAVALGLVLRYLTLWLWATAGLYFNEFVEQSTLNLFHPNWRVLVIVAAVANTAVLMPAWFSMGALVARLHERHTTLLFILAALVGAVPRYGLQLLSAVGDPHLRPFVPLHLTMIVIWSGAFAISTVAGGLFMTPQSRQTG